MAKNVLWRLGILVLISIGFAVSISVLVNQGWQTFKAWHARVPPNAQYSVTPFDNNKAVKTVCQIESDGTVVSKTTIFDSDGQILGESESTGK